MTNYINNIKKYFIYIVGIVFFIIAIYIMLMPPNSALKKMSIKEGFASNSNNTTMDYTNTTNLTGICSKGDKIYDSITCYRNIVSQKLGNPKVFDEKYLQTSVLPETISDKNRKTLIMSRCYQFDSDSELLKTLLTKTRDKKQLNNLFVSYTEYIHISTNDFGDVLSKINDNINSFYQYLNIYNKKDTKQVKSKISGCVYVIISQIPYYKDTADPKNNNVLNINNNVPQSQSPTDKLVYYSPSYVGNISSYLKNPTQNKNKLDTTTPITYNVYIIYDNYKSGPQSTNNKIELASNNNTFSTSKLPNDLSKINLDTKYISGSDKCFISAVGTEGMNYIGGCTSYNDTIGNSAQKTICQSPIQGGKQKPWSYVVLYTVNRPDIIQNVVYKPK